MGLFFNYDKPGPGIDKNAPKKKGIALFFDLLWRNIGKLFLSNILYFVVSLPILVLYAMIFSMFYGNIILEEVGTVGFLQIVVISTVIVAILWGTGPVSCGYAYILRNITREEHTFIVSDFFEKTKENFWHGLVTLLVDTLMLVIFSVSLLTYHNLAEKTGGIYSILYYVVILIMIIYTIMHFYLYEMDITFENGIRNLYKNAFLMSIATFPMCILILAIICILSFMILRFFAPIAVLIIAALCWISFMRFIIDFYTARVIKKFFLQENQETNE